PDTWVLHFRLPGGVLDVDRPLLPPLGDWLAFILALARAVLLFVPGALQGFIAALLVRPASRAADIAVGAGSGLVAGLILFVVALAPDLQEQENLRSHQDLRLLERAAANAEPAPPGKAADPIVETYPQWGDLDRAKRCEALRK